MSLTSSLLTSYKAILDEIIPVKEQIYLIKLNKYLYKKFTQEHEEFVIPSENWPFTEEDIEQWIVEWYKDIYDREPPLWLTGKRWYDRRQQKIDEAELL